MPDEGVARRIRSTATRGGVSRVVWNAHGAADGLGWVLERGIAAPCGRPRVRCPRHGGPRFRVLAERPGSSDPRRHHDRRPHPITGTATPCPGSDRHRVGRSRAANPPRRGVKWKPLPKGRAHASNPAGDAVGSAALMPNRPSERAASESAPALAQVDEWRPPPSYSLSAPVDTGADPGDQLPEANRVIREPGGSPLGLGEDVEPILGDVDPDGAEDAHHSLLLFLSCEPRCSGIHSGRREGRWRPYSTTAPHGQDLHGPTTVPVRCPRRRA